MAEFEKTARTRLRLYRELGSYDKEQIYSCIDAAHICHVSAIVAGAPYIQTTRHWRIGDNIYMHGAATNKMVDAIRQGAEACLAFSLFDGYALTRSAFNHAVLYRSVVAFSRGRFVEDHDEKREKLRAFIESVEPGRWETIRQPTIAELEMTGVIEFELSEVSAKALLDEITPLIFPGGDFEAEEDATVDPWTGIIPYTLTQGNRVHSRDVPPLPDDKNPFKS